MLNATEPRNSVRSLLASVVHQHPERPAISYRLEPSDASELEPQVLRTLSWHEVAQLVLDTARALDGALGASRIVAVLAETDARYPVLELAVGVTGRVLQPLYVESADAELQRSLELSGAEALVVGCSQLARARRAALELPVFELAHLVRLPGVQGAPHAALSPDVEPFDTHGVRRMLNALPMRAPEAALLYLQSTGTTGPARVIEISEAALLQALWAVESEASQRFPRFLSFLPTAHISERLLTLYVSLALAGHTHYGGGLATLEADLRACRPTAFLAPPLLFESIRRSAIEQASVTGLGKRLLRAVQRSADALLASGSTGGARRSVGARVFGRKLQKGLGLDQVKDALSGTAPMPAELHAWCEAAGLPLRIVYGQTEVAGATTITSRTGARFGSVGLPVGDVELRISEEGELLVRSAAAFTRYIEGAAPALPKLEPAWLRTGDRAMTLPDGEFVLLGRAQSLVITEGGSRLDTAAIADEIQRILGDTEVAFYRPTGEPALYLYLAVHPPNWRPGAASSLVPVPASDTRMRQLEKMLTAADPERVIRKVVLFNGAFGQTSGEIGPTGKPRPWRIHEIHHAALRERH